MSVPKSERDEGKLEVLNCCRELHKYTYERVRDREIFPKAERWLLCKDIWDAVSTAYTSLIHANGIYVESADEADERILYEKNAIIGLETALVLIDLCFLENKIDEARCVYWTGLATDALDKAKGYLKNDKRRYAKYRSNNAN